MDHPLGSQSEKGCTSFKESHQKSVCQQIYLTNSGIFNILKCDQPGDRGKREEEEGSKLYEDIEGRYTDEFVWKDLEVEALADTAEAEEDEKRQCVLFNEK